MLKNLLRNTLFKMALFVAVSCSFLTPVKAQICNAAGNLMLFTNYDGGTLTINVDQNIPGLKIGVCSYEGTKIVLTGAFAANVTAVSYAGYNGNNSLCGTVINTSINGAAVGTATNIAILPASPLANSYGYSSIICGFSCSNNTNQGGCNTVDQIEAYFLNYFPGSTLFAHKVQYGCWTGTLAVSVGGNCCPASPVIPGVVASSQTLCGAGVPAPFTSSTLATGGSGTINYLWQLSTTSSSSGFSNISGATSTTYAPGLTSVTTYYRRSASTSTSNVAYSNVIAVTVNPLPTVTISGANSLCNGTSTTYTASTASGSPTYTWLPSLTTGSLLPVTPTVTTTYTVICSASGCSNSATQQVTVYQLPSISAISNATAVCTGQTATLTASGGAVYNWMPGNLSGTTVTVSPSLFTTYTITGTDANGCTNQAFLALGVNPLPNVTVTPTSVTVCSGSSATLTASGAVNYSWLPGNGSGASIVITPTASMVYTVTGDNGSCSNVATHTLSLIPSPTVTLNASKSEVCPGQSVVLSAGGASGYILLNTAAALAGNSVAVSPTITTSYSVSGTAPNNCTNVGVNTVTVDICTGVDSALQNGANELTVFPNPNKGEFMIKGRSAAQVKIIDLQGKQISAYELNSKNNYEASVSNLNAGIYFVVSNSQSGTSMQKIMVTK